MFKNYFPLCAPEGEGGTGGAGEGGDGGQAPATQQPTGGQAATDLTGGQGGQAPATQQPATQPNQVPDNIKAHFPEATPEDVAYLQTKGWDKSENPARDILASYRNLEKVFGADKAGNTIAIPGADADQAAWDNVYNKLGRPEKAEDYSAPKFEGLSDELDQGLRSKAHEIGVSDKQLQELSTWNNEATQALHQQWEQEAQTEFQQQSDNLDKEWGAAKEANVQLAREASQKMGWTEEQVQAMQMALGYDGVMKLALNIGKSISEGKFVSSDGGRTTGVQGVMTPEQARAELNKLPMDKEFMAAWADKNHAKHAEAVQRKSTLSRWASGQQ